MKYPDFDDAIKLCRSLNVYQRTCPLYFGKSDMSMAFRQVPMRVKDFCLLILKAQHPETNEIFYFIDKCLSFGSSISCAIFQEVSNGIAHIFRIRTSCETINYLDDFFFAALLQGLCDLQVKEFLQICKQIGFPISMEKTVWGKTVMTFLGFLINSELQIVCIPVDKVVRALELIQFFLGRKKVTVHDVQKLAGFLNFLCRCVIPGRAFTRRFYALMAGTNKNLKPHHHVRVKKENKLDLQIWVQFLTNPQVFCRPFHHFGEFDIEIVQMHSDASGNFRFGYGAWCRQIETNFKGWLQEAWDIRFMREFKPSIEFLELFGVAAAILAWIERFANRKIYIFCDNESVCNMLNNSSSSCEHCMVLIRLITLKTLLHNVHIFGKHLKTDLNGTADALSRSQMERFERLAPDLAAISKTETPAEIWPISKAWHLA